jgi:hypothetical protein
MRCRHAARFAFHSSMLEEGINTYASSEVDIWRSGIDKRDFSLTLLTGTVPVDVVIQSNTDKAVKRSYINLKGPPSIVKGAEEYSAHSYVFPDAKALKQLVRGSLLPSTCSSGFISPVCSSPKDLMRPQQSAHFNGLVITWERHESTWQHQ